MAYATTNDLTNYLGVAAPSGAARLLDRASELIDYATYGRITPTNADEMEAAKLATCQQVEYWILQGEDGDINGIKYESLSIGTYQAVYDNTQATSSLAPRARRTLFLAGMLFKGVRMI